MTRPRPDIDVSPILLDANWHKPLEWDEKTREFGPEDWLNWTALFANDHPVELEIGSGKGLFLANAARARPNHNFLGVEIARKYARLAAERIVKQRLANVRIWPADAMLATRLVPDGSLHAVHVYFPDPWWKKRHKKRRVFNEGLVVQIVRGLKSGGELHVATDVVEYYDLIRGLVTAEPRLAELSAPQLTGGQSEQDYLTNFERKFRQEGRPIHRSLFRRS